MTHVDSSIQPSEAEIKAINAEREAAVESLVTELLERLNRLEAKLEELQERLKQDSYNRSIIVIPIKNEAEHNLGCFLEFSLE